MKNKDVTLEFLIRLSISTVDLPEEDYQVLVRKVVDRLDFGLGKYRVPLTVDTPMDSLKMAWEEAFDGCQYLLKAAMEGKGAGEIFEKQLDILLDIEALQTILYREGNVDGGETGTG